MTGQVKIGDRIKLLHPDVYTRVKPGHIGTCWDISTFDLHYEKIRQLWIYWENGSRSTLIEGKDEYEIIT